MANIKTLIEERHFDEYRALRDKPRQTIAGGVYPNAKKCLTEYTELLAGLSGDIADYADYHAEATAPVAPYIEQLKAAMQAIVTIVEGIEQAAPGTFGVGTNV